MLSFMDMLVFLYKKLFVNLLVFKEKNYLMVDI